MEKLLPIGSIVVLNNGKQKLMITARGSLYNNEGTIGYLSIQVVFIPLDKPIHKLFSLMRKILKRSSLRGIEMKMKKNIVRCTRNKFKKQVIHD